VLRWLRCARTWFSEWLAPPGYDEDLLAVLTLVDFAGDARSAARHARRRHDRARHGAPAFRGAFAVRTGVPRAPCQRSCEEGTADAMKLLLGRDRSRASRISAPWHSRSPEADAARAAAIAADVERPAVIGTSAGTDSALALRPRSARRRV
jgi:hypothetical protein